MKSIALIHFNHSTSDGVVTWPDMRTSAWKPNYGDMLVCSAILRQIEPANYERSDFGYDLRKPVDLAIVRGSTYLHNNFDFQAAIRTIDSIDAPIAVVGLGAQNPQHDLTYLDHNPLASEFIKKIAEKSASISVRGEFTADVVRRLGGKNIRVTGCPSLFYQENTPVIRIPEMLAYPERRLGISIHSGVSRNIFCADPVATRAMHGQAIRFALNNSAGVRIFEQGSPSEYMISDRTASFHDRQQAALDFLERVGMKEEMPARSLISLFSSIKNLPEWIGKAGDVDAMIGFRFHGNMVAMCQGIPCYYYTYDSRLKEFCDLYHLPSQDVAESFKNPVKMMMDHDWDATNQAIESCSREMQSFWAENQVATKKER